MGMDADAILFYGYCWSEAVIPWRDPNADSDDGDDVNEDRDPEERYAQACGAKHPAEAYPPDRDRSPEADRIRAAYAAYWEKKRPLVAACPCEVAYHGHGNDPLAYLAVKASKQWAWLGEPRPLSVEQMQTQPDWDKALDDYCAKTGITPPQAKPGWWLVSYCSP